MRRGQAPPLRTIVLIMMPGAGRSGGVQGVKVAEVPGWPVQEGLFWIPPGRWPGLSSVTEWREWRPWMVLAQLLRIALPRNQIWECPSSCNRLAENGNLHQGGDSP